MGMCCRMSLSAPRFPPSMPRLAALTSPGTCGVALLILCTSWQAVVLLGRKNSMSDG